MGFPQDDYTPFGLLGNPWAFARSWEEGFGGTLRATEQRPGFGWLEPWATSPKLGFGLEIGFEHDGRPFLTRNDFAGIGLKSTYHSANVLEYSWEYASLIYRVRFYCAGPKVLAARCQLSNRETECTSARLLIGRWCWQREDCPSLATPTLAFRGDVDVKLLESDERTSEHVGRHFGIINRSLARVELTVPQGSDATCTVLLSGGSGASPEPVRDLHGLIAEDEAFWETCPQLSGDWPAEFRRGLVYDFETTRMCLQPPGGIFNDVWPAWMVSWPRLVLAEGSLDMLRLSFAAPGLAKRAVLSMFRDAAAANVPCVFKHGEPNMVAEDGSICGTSPAWCVPFHNLRRLYLRTMDREWLAELYPHLAAYVRWWLANRSDENGWTVYKCTWEAGEDNSPRLDPERAGNHVISQYVRPIELQSAMADAAATLRFFAREIGVGDSEQWREVQRAAYGRVQQLWDSQLGRFRDWDTRRNGFVEAFGEDNYWGVDPCRFSALSLTPLLFGQTTAQQETALRREIEHYANPPWREWPSWSYVVLEAASRGGFYDFAGKLAYDICRRVYTENDRHALADRDTPMPGVAREYWPIELSTWNASEGYGWGATTASFVIRQLCGFYEAADTDVSAFRLAPAFPSSLINGRELCIGPLPYRGQMFHLSYRLLQEALEVCISLPRATGVRARDERTGRRLLDAQPSLEHVFRLVPGHTARVELVPSS